MNYLHLYTGNGKGKTTAAVGLAVRAAGAGLKVAFVQFDKGYDGTNEHYNERHILRTLPNIQVMATGLERMMPDGKFRFQNSDEDLAEASRGLAAVKELLEAGGADLVILDELITCVGTKLVGEADVMDVVESWKGAGRKCELVLTGRGAWPALIDTADLVTEMNLVKHYWYEHKAEARPGIDY